MSGNKPRGPCSESLAPREAPEVRISAIIYRIKTPLCPSGEVAGFQWREGGSEPRTHGLDGRTETVWLKVAVKSS